MLVYRLESTIDDTKDVLYNKLLCFDSKIGHLSVKECEPFQKNEITDDEIFQKFNIEKPEKYRLIINDKVKNAYSYPFKLYVDITDNCQLNCKHCLNSELNYNKQLEMSKIDEIIKECKEHGLFYVKLGGGEPLLHPNIIEIIKKFSEAGIFVSLSTNSLLVNENLAKVFNKYNVKVSISLEGPKKLDGSIRGDGHYDCALKAINTLKENGCKPLIRVTLTREMLNIEYMLQMIDLVKEQGLKLKISYCRPSGSALDNQLLVQYEDNEKYYEIIKLLNKKEYEEVIILDEGMQIKQDPNLKSILYNNKICGSANRSMHINSSGNISPCVFFGDDFLEKESNYEKGDILNYWNESKGTQMRKVRNIEIPNYCYDCNRLCKLECSATRYYFNKDFNKQDPNCLKGVVKCLKQK